MTRREYFQAGYVVPDLYAGIDQWLETTDIGPFYIMRDIRPENGLYRGAPSELSMQIALAQAGPLQIELIEQTSDGPSVYRDAFPKGASGFHHLCYVVDDLQEEVRRYNAKGIETGYIASVGPLNFAYFDTWAVMNGYTEVLESDPGVLDMFKMIADAAEGWDGKDPIRYVEG